MFGKPPKFPIATSEKVSVERSLDWLMTTLGLETVPRFQPLTRRSPTVRACQSPESILELVQQQLPFSFPDIHIHVLPPEHDSMLESLQPLGRAEQNELLIRAEEVNDLDMLIGQLSCLLSDRFLFETCEPPTEEIAAQVRLFSEFLPCLYGLGVFCANSSLVSSNVTTGEEHLWAQWKFREIPARFFGVALACLAYRNSASIATFERELRPDARVPLKKALKYYQKTNDCQFAPESQIRVFQNSDNHQLIGILNNATDSTTYAALEQLHLNIQLSEDFSALAAITPDLPRWLGHPDGCIRKLAAQLAVKLEYLDDDVLEGLRCLLADRDSLIREAALQTLVAGPSFDRVSIADIRASLSDYDLNVADWAAMGIVQLGQQDEKVASDVLPTIRRAINVGQWETAVHLCEALEILSPNWRAKLDGYFSDSPHQLRELLHGLDEWKKVTQNAQRVR